MNSSDDYKAGTLDIPQEDELFQIYLLGREFAEILVADLVSAPRNTE